ncbi:MAG TPA: prepilin-type N-terminal cleavage/methylation domain-containing protein [Myxococcota bacterium]|nr:prepilin-type N-terminal cleavage/methylation domain-containing protein [Myxococcota bacterium]
MRNRTTRLTSHPDSGFTLIEVMIAMAILGIGLLAIAAAQITAMRVSSRSKNMQQAMFLAREQLDDMDALLPGSAVLQTAATIADPANPIKVTNDAENGTSFNRSMQIIPNNPTTDMAQVIVTVAWNNATTSAPSQVVLSAIKRMN